MVAAFSGVHFRRVMLFAAFLLFAYLGNTQTFVQWIQSGKAHMDSLEFPEAITAFEAAVTLDSTSAEAYCYLGTAKSIVEIQSGLEELEKAIALDSTYAPAYSRISEILAFRNEPEKSFIYCQKAFALDPNFWNTVRYARKNEYRNPQLALKLYGEATEMDHEERVVAYVDRGMLLFNIGRYTEASDNFTQALALKNIVYFPVEWLEVFANAYILDGSKAKACELWQKALQLDIGPYKEHFQQKIQENCE